MNKVSNIEHLFQIDTYHAIIQKPAKLTGSQ